MKMAFLGDSITFGTGVENIENRYDNVLKRLLNLSDTYNLGDPGTPIAPLASANGDPEKGASFCARRNTVPDDADVIVIFGGTNDYGLGNVPFGTIKDKTVDTFCGSVDFLISELKKEYKNSKIVFIAPSHRLGDAEPSKKEGKLSDAKPLEAYVDIIVQKCTEFKIPVLNLYDELGIDPNCDKDRMNYAPDGLHFNDEGHSIIAQRTCEFLKKLFCK